MKDRQTVLHFSVSHFSVRRLKRFDFAQCASPNQFVDDRVEIILRDPFDDRNADRVAESEERLICGRGNFVIIRAHQPGAFAWREESREVFSLARFEEYLSAAAAPRRAQTTGYAVGPQFGH